MFVYPYAHGVPSSQKNNYPTSQSSHVKHVYSLAPFMLSPRQMFFRHALTAHLTLVIDPFKTEWPQK
jgi:dolichyl-phosphate-mannose--protein O-mannosyl transferase